MLTSVYIDECFKRQVGASSTRSVGMIGILIHWFYTIMSVVVVDALTLTRPA